MCSRDLVQRRGEFLNSVRRARREAETMRLEKGEGVMNAGRLVSQLPFQSSRKGLPKGVNVQQIFPTVHTKNGILVTEAASPSR